MIDDNDFVIFVNSCDKFSDCWSPFFLLFSKNSPQKILAPIYLNTEYLDFTLPELDIRPLKNGDKGRTWSESLIYALTSINAPLILYLQEDYFVNEPVNWDQIMRYVDYMRANEDIKHIGLTHFGSEPPFSEYENELVLISQESRYRIATQAGLWRRETLLKYLRPDESGWMFEIFGTKRAAAIKEKFLTVDREYIAKHGKIFSYKHTGIIKGKWNPEIIEDFQRFDVEVDFAERGFYKKRGRIRNKLETLLSMTKNPGLLLKKVLINK